MVDLNKLKIGDCIMYDRGSCRYVTIATINGIDRLNMQFGKEKVILNLRHVYERQRITEDGTMDEDLISYNYSDKLYITPDSRERISGKLYKITKTEFNNIQNAYDKLVKIKGQTMDAFRNLYFDKKMK